MGFPVYRTSPFFRWKAHYQYQVGWMMFIWGISMFALSILLDLFAVLSGSYNGVVRYMRMSKSRMALHVMGRAIALLYMYGLPVMFGRSWKWGLLYHVVAGTIFMAMTQVGHLVPECLDGASSRNPCWSAHQVLSSHGFAHGSWWWFMWSGGLNYQVEHHLFPGINHEHHHLLAPIVRRLCTKYGLHYPYSPTYSNALWKHWCVVLENTKKYAHLSKEAEMQHKAQAALDDDKVPTTPASSHPMQLRSRNTTATPSQAGAEQND
jgi:delta11-fatty-acid desaturase